MKGVCTRRGLEGEATKTGYKIAVADNVAAVVTIAALEDVYHVIKNIQCSYDDTPGAGATLIIAFGGVTIWQIDIVASGSKQFSFPEGIHNDATEAEACVITLSAPGASKGGELNVQYV